MWLDHSDISDHKTLTLGVLESTFKSFSLIQSQILMIFSFISQSIVQAEEVLAMNGFPKELEVHRKAYLVSSILDYLYQLCDDLSQNPFDADPRAPFVDAV
jgi:hypothetical protein